MNHDVLKPSGEAQPAYDAEQRAILLDVAARSIALGLDQGRPFDPDPFDYPPALRASLATFVTLEIDQALRGCIGVLEAIRPLVRDVALNAFAAAFEDPRFAPLRAAEYPGLTLKISILSPPQPMHCASEADLLAQIRPGIDGLILREQGHRGTFLPSVWEQLPDSLDFLRHLKRKAGLPIDYWSSRLEISRYTSESFGKSLAQSA
jgi:AmmeMemoRadiSam system protein A